MHRANGERNTVRVYAGAHACMCVCELRVMVYIRVFARAKERCAEMFSPGQHGVTLGIQSKLSPPSFSSRTSFPLSSKFLLFDRLLAYLPTYLPTYLPVRPLLFLLLVCCFFHFHFHFFFFFLLLHSFLLLLRLLRS